MADCAKLDSIVLMLMYLILSEAQITVQSLDRVTATVLLTFTVHSMPKAQLTVAVWFLKMIMFSVGVNTALNTTANCCILLTLTCTADSKFNAESRGLMRVITPFRL